MDPKNSAEVAIRIYDKARELGIPAKIQSSLVAHSDSRYVILFPRQPNEQVIRISGHRPYEPRYALCVDVHSDSMLKTAADYAINWLEKNYGTEIQEVGERGGIAPTSISNGGVGGSGHLLSGISKAIPRSDEDFPHRVRCRSPRRVRTTDTVEKWSSSEARRVRDEWNRDD